MPLTIFCDACDQELDEPAALIFLPQNQFGNAPKLHICVDCLPTVMLAVKELRIDNDLVV